MQVRLGFAVAAFLDPELLLVDEVLSVGDAEFREKSVAKMHELAQSGRTIIFVSHNLDTVSQLCPQTMLLWKGELVGFGETPEMLYQYREKVAETSSVHFSEEDGVSAVKNISIQKLEMFVDGALSVVVHTTSNVTFTTTLQRKNLQIEEEVLAQITILSERYQKISQLIHKVTFTEGISTLIVQCLISNFPLLAGKYYIDVLLVQNGSTIDKAAKAIGFDVLLPKERNQLFGKGVYYIPANWEISVE
jgi:lipopolysaccharide transport system ATP-binding protein